MIVVCVSVFALQAGGQPMKRDSVLYRHPERYAAFPSLCQSRNDELWVSFGWNTTRSHYGRAAGGERGSVALYSPDAGETWHQAKKDEAYVGRPAECSAFVMKDGTLVRIGPRMHEVLPMSKKEELERRGVNVKVWPAGHISASYRVRLHRRVPGAAGWESSYADLPTFASMGGFGRGVVLDDDTILKPVYGFGNRDDHATRAWALRSSDKGKSWQLVTMAYDGVHCFNEAELLALPNGHVLGMIRVWGSRVTGPLYERGFLWQVVSEDGGMTWSKPRMTPMWGYPPHLLLTRRGEVLCTYGYRRPPYGIRACFSRDLGRTWDAENEVILRWDALPKGPGAGRGSIGDLGYPRTVQLRDGTFLTVYYVTLGDFVTHIAATKWSRDYVGPRDMKRGAAAVSKPDPSLPPECIVGEVSPTPLKYGVMQSFVPTKPRIQMVAVRVSKESGRDDLVHTNGLYVVVRKPTAKTWWTKFLGKSRTLKPHKVKVGGWNAFVFDKPVAVTPGETYVLTVYNLDYLGGGPTRLKPGLTGDHSWFLNTNAGHAADYPNGSMSANTERDIAFKVYHDIGPLPETAE